MDTLITFIRNQLKMTQEQFAKELGTSSVTVSRWENGKSKPNFMAQKQIYQLCEKYEVDLKNFILENSSGQDCLYHASRSKIKGPIQPISRSKCDFGKGFYMGENPLQPLTLVCNEEKPTFYKLKIDLIGLNCLKIDVNLDWVLLISYLRGDMDEYQDTSLYQKYSNMMEGVDLVVGSIADDRMYQVLNDFFEGNITDSALIHSLSALKLGKQYVAITKKACDQITILEEKEISLLELLALRDISQERRKEGIHLALEMTRKYRRDGYFYDEILRGEDHG